MGNIQFILDLSEFKTKWATLYPKTLSKDILLKRCYVKGVKTVACTLKSRNRMQCCSPQIRNSLLLSLLHLWYLGGIETHLVLLKQVNIVCVVSQINLTWSVAESKLQLAKWNKRKQRGITAAAFPVLLVMSYGCTPGSVTILSPFPSHTLSAVMPLWTPVAQCRCSKNRGAAVKEYASSLLPPVLWWILLTVFETLTAVKVCNTDIKGWAWGKQSPTGFCLTPLKLFLVKAEVSCII